MRLLWVVPVLLLLAGCGGTEAPEEVDIPRVESAIKAQVKKDAGVRIAVDCPASVAWDTGSEFHCIAKDPSGTYAKTMITVSMENDAGAFTWRVER